MTGQGSGRGPEWRTYQRPDVDDVERETSDLDGRPLERPATTAPAPAVVVPDVAERRRRPWWVPVLVAAIVVGGGVGFLYLRGGESAPDPLPREGRYEPILTAGGLDRIAQAMEAELGDTRVLEVWFEGDTTIRLTRPPAGPDELADEWRWDGSTLTLQAAYPERVEREPFDIRDIDPEVLVEVEQEARRRSDGDISASISRVERPASDYDHWIYLRVTEVDHGGVVLWADLEGNIASELINTSWRDD